MRKVVNSAVSIIRFIHKKSQHSENIIIRYAEICFYLCCYRPDICVMSLGLVYFIESHCSASS